MQRFSYYFAAFLFKVPLSIQIIFLWALISYVKNRRQYHFFENESFLLIPTLSFFVYLDFFFKAQIGIRHLLIVFPLIFIFCGSLLQTAGRLGAKPKFILGFLIIWQIISALSYSPHYLSYFNELVWDRTQSYKILADSNLDWGQGRWYLRQYLKDHPEAKVLPQVPTSGRIIVGSNDLVGLFNPEKYRWLRENFKPVGNIAYSYLIYDVPAGRLEEISKKGQTSFQKEDKSG